MNGVTAFPGVYIHVPFCKKKCPYCGFYSVLGDQDLFERYTRRICEMLLEARSRWGLSFADTLYFGGGTPSLLGPKRIGQIIGAAHKAGLSSAAEITLEANPDEDLIENLKDFSAQGINRLSLGLQSGNENELQFLKRSHSPQLVKNCVLAAADAGISNISLDLMLGTPQQQEDSIAKSIAFCAALPVSHISAYLLKIEPETPFDCDEIRTLCADEDRQADFYLHAVNLLARHGFVQYEISNFAKNGQISHHNCKYWTGAPYFGFGPSAHSFFAGKRGFFPGDLAKFLDEKDPFALFVPDGTGGDPQERFLLQMRLCEGVCQDDFARQFPFCDWDSVFKKAKPYQKAGYLAVTNGCMRFTPTGFLLSNSVLADLLADF